LISYIRFDAKVGDSVTLPDAHSKPGGIPMPRPSDPHPRRALRALLIAGLLSLVLALAALPAPADENTSGPTQGQSPPAAEVDDFAYGDGHDGNGGGGGTHEGDPDDPLDLGTNDQLTLIERTLEISILFGI